MILLIFGQEEKYNSTIELLKFIEERRIHVLKSMHNMMTLPSLKACMPKCQLSCTELINVFDLNSPLISTWQ